MRRLNALIKKIVPVSAETQAEFLKSIKTLDLLPGEWIPDDMPTGTTIFVEEGFLLLTSYIDNHWKCSNFYFEGTAAATYSAGATELKENSFRVKAIEPSRIYYLTREDAARLSEITPHYNVALSILRQRSFMKSEQRRQVFHFPLSFDRIAYIATYFPVLLRAPIEDLMEFLRLEHELDRPVLEAFQTNKVTAKRSSPQKN